MWADPPNTLGDDLRPSAPHPAAQSAQPEETLAMIAGRILEGEVVDWEGVTRSSEGDASRVLEQLHALEDLAAFHRSVQRSGTGRAAEWELQAWGDLEIIELIGSGSFGTVYQAWDPKLDREVALKILRPADESAASGERPVAPATAWDSGSQEVSPRTAARAIGEARLLAKIHHPNVVTVFGADEVDGLVGIWMELIEGETLASVVRRQGPFGASEAIAIGHDLLSALAAAHTAGILHRDIKAQNVMRAVGGRIVLMDFGLGKDVRQESDRDWAMGAALYAAPERLGGGDATVQSDLYGLGVLLYYLVTGRFPFEAASLAQLREAHDRGTHAYLRDRRPDLPRPLVEVIERALRPAPGERYRSAGEMDMALMEARKVSRSSLAHARRWAVAVRVPRPNWRRLAWLLPLPILVVLGVWLGTLGRYSVNAALCRDLPRGGQTSLTSRDFIGPNDRLFLEFRASRDLYVYVVERDTQGSLQLLFPSRRQPAQNPLSRDEPHRLSDLLRGEDLDRAGAAAGERYQFLFIASPQPLTELEGALRNPDRRDFPRIADEILIRGLGKHLSAPREGGAVTDRTEEKIFAQVRPLGPEEGSLRGVWIRRLELTRAPQSYQPVDRD